MKLRRGLWAFAAASALAAPVWAAGPVVPPPGPARLVGQTKSAVSLPDQSGAEEAPALGPVVPPVVAGEPQVDAQPAAGVAAPTAEEPKRSWLRQPRETREDKADEKSSGDWTLSVLALVMLGGLAGAAVVMKLRRGAPAPWLPPAPVRVLSTTRLSPKASLITAEVHGRVLLLGVTEETVTELGWLDGTSESLAAANDDADAAEEHRGASAVNTEPARGFGQVLGTVFRAGERKPKDVEFRGNPNVAALIAARETRDVVSTNYSRAAAGAERRSSPNLRAAEPEAARVETQVAGLVRRRR